MKHILRGLILVAAAGAAPFVASAASPDPAKTRQLVGVVQSSTDLGERARALQQLALVGSKEAVPALVGLLADAQLGQYARDVLEVMPDPAAGEALRAALGQLHGNALIGVVNSLGVRREVKAVDALARIAGDRTSVAAEPALLALGRIGSPEAARVLEQTFANGPAELRAPAVEAWLLIANRWLDDGKRAPALAIFERVRRTDLPCNGAHCGGTG